MGSRYLTDMADVLRSAGLKVVEVDGWKSRARGSGGYVGTPQAVMMHHTASKASAGSDVQYMTFTSPIAPIANLYVARDGAVWVMAAGASNTNGRGGPLGPIPKDGMNSRAIGIEIGNDGVGEPYPEKQQQASLVAARALCAAYRIPTSNVWAHFEWAPGRKIDPAGPSRWSGNAYRQWDMVSFRKDLTTSVIPPPPEEGENVLVNLIKHKNHAAVYAQYSGGYKTWIPDGNTLGVYQFLSGKTPEAMPDDSWMKATGPIVGPVPSGVDEWGIPN